MKTPPLIVCFLALTLVCDAQVFSDYDAQTDWKKYRTFAWLAPGDTVLNRYRGDKLYGGLITYAANEQLIAHGMRPDSVGPDGIFVFYTSVEEEVEYSQSATLSVGVAVAGPGYYAGGMAPVAGGKITAHTVEDGQLVYEMYDSRTGKLLWKGGDRKKFKMSDDIQGIIQASTKKIFKKFPVKIRS
jgi:hypothetical protein